MAEYTNNPNNIVFLKDTNIVSGDINEPSISKNPIVGLDVALLLSGEIKNLSSEVFEKDNTITGDKNFTGETTFEGDITVNKEFATDISATNISSDRLVVNSLSVDNAEANIVNLSANCLTADNEQVSNLTVNSLLVNNGSNLSDTEIHGTFEYSGESAIDKFSLSGINTTGTEHKEKILDATGDGISTYVDIYAKNNVSIEKDVSVKNDVSIDGTATISKAKVAEEIIEKSEITDLEVTNETILNDVVVSGDSSISGALSIQLDNYLTVTLSGYNHESVGDNKNVKIVDIDGKGISASVPLYVDTIKASGKLIIEDDLDVNGHTVLSDLSVKNNISAGGSMFAVSSDVVSSLTTKGYVDNLCVELLTNINSNDDDITYISGRVDDLSGEVGEISTDFENRISQNENDIETISCGDMIFTGNKKFNTMPSVLVENNNEYKSLVTQDYVDQKLVSVYRFKGVYSKWSNLIEYWDDINDGENGDVYYVEKDDNPERNGDDVGGANYVLINKDNTSIDISAHFIYFGGSFDINKLLLNYYTKTRIDESVDVLVANDSFLSGKIDTLVEDDSFLSGKIDNILTGDTTFGGLKRFSKIPQVIFEDNGGNISYSEVAVLSDVIQRDTTTLNAAKEYTDKEILSAQLSAHTYTESIIRNGTFADETIDSSTGTGKLMGVWLFNKDTYFDNNISVLKNANIDKDLRVGHEESACLCTEVDADLIHINLSTDLNGSLSVSDESFLHGVHAENVNLSNLEVNGYISAAHDISVYGNEYLSNDLTINNKLSVTDSGLNIQVSTYMSSDLEVDGKFTVNDQLSSTDSGLNVQVPTYMSSDLEVDGKFTVTNELSITDSSINAQVPVTFISSLNVSGDTTTEKMSVSALTVRNVLSANIPDGVDIEKSVSVGNDLTVGVETSCLYTDYKNDKLYIKLSTDLDGSLSTNNNITVDGNFVATGKLSVDDDKVTINKNTEITGTLNVNSDISSSTLNVSTSAFIDTLSANNISAKNAYLSVTNITADYLSVTTSAFVELLSVNSISADNADFNATNVYADQLTADSISIDNAEDLSIGSTNLSALISSEVLSYKEFIKGKAEEALDVLSANPVDLMTLLETLSAFLSAITTI